MAPTTKMFKKKTPKVTTTQQFLITKENAMVTMIRLVLVMVLIVWISDNSRALQQSPDETTTEEQGQESRWHAQQIDFDGHSRTYVAYTPTSYTGLKPVPLVIVLHGTSDRSQPDLVFGKHTTRYPKWDQKAEAEGFITVAPLALGRAFNDGSGRCESFLQDVDDVGFIEAVINDVSNRFAIDQDSIYASGNSSGASMAQRLSIELSHRIAAIGAVAGHLWSEDRAPMAARSVLLLFGTEDKLNPIDGGKVHYMFLDHPLEKPAPLTTAKMWARHLNCSSEPTDMFNKDGVRAVAWHPCANGSEVILYTVTGLGHHWPGGLHNPSWDIYLGKYTDVINATDIIWDFFSRHHRR